MNNKRTLGMLAVIIGDTIFGFSFLFSKVILIAESYGIKFMSSSFAGIILLSVTYGSLRME
ncbi:MAG: hypothetical protein K6E46_05470 [Lachnospiraceae bacterium]|nr:hypothetical protein [Lachnospiraceae bacterium]